MTNAAICSKMKFVTSLLCLWIFVGFVSALETTDKKVPNDDLADIKRRLGSLEQMVGQLITQNSSLDVVRLPGKTSLPLNLNLMTCITIIQLVNRKYHFRSL
jgi:hypothetical protein